MTLVWEMFGHNLCKQWQDLRENRVLNFCLSCVLSEQSRTLLKQCFPNVFISGHNLEQDSVCTILEGKHRPYVAEVACRGALDTPGCAAKGRNLFFYLN